VASRLLIYLRQAGDTAISKSCASSRRSPAGVPIPLGALPIRFVNYLLAAQKNADFKNAGRAGGLFALGQLTIDTPN
jgi:hypothetical protein